MRYEYKVEYVGGLKNRFDYDIYGKDLNPILTEVLNRLGSEGWELVSVVALPNSFSQFNQYNLFLKRVIMEGKTL